MTMLIFDLERKSTFNLDTELIYISMWHLFHLLWRGQHLIRIKQTTESTSATQLTTRVCTTGISRETLVIH